MKAALLALLLVSAAALPAAAQGQYGQDLGMRQKAWMDPGKNKAGDQRTAGYKICEYEESATCRVNIRITQNVHIQLPPGEFPLDIALGDTVTFNTATIQGAPNALYVEALQAGFDTSLHIQTKKRNYRFQLASYGREYERIADNAVKVQLKNAGLEAHGGIPRAQGPDFYGPAKSQAHRRAPAPAPWEPNSSAIYAPEPPDGARFGHVPFDPAQIVRDLDVYGIRGDQASRDALVPRDIFRDRHFTYIDYGRKAETMDAFPAVYLESNGAELPVQTEIRGQMRQMIVAKAVGNLVLRSGRLVLFVQRNIRRMGPDRFEEPSFARPEPDASEASRREYRIVTRGISLNQIRKLLRGRHHEAPVIRPDGWTHTPGLDYGTASQTCYEIQELGGTCNALSDRSFAP